MPSTPRLPGYPSAPRGFRSHALFHWRAADLSLDALSGQAGTLVRAATATGVAVGGETVTYRNHQPAWTMLDLDADSIRETPALNLSSAAVVSWPFPRSGRPGALTAYAKFRHAGFGYTAGSGGVIALESAAAANPRWAILQDGANNDGRLTTLHHNGTSSVNSALGSGVADSTDCEYLVTLSATGQVQVTRVTAAGATTTATQSGTLTVNAFSGDLLRAYAAVALMVLKIGGGIRTLDEMRELG